MKIQKVNIVILIAIGFLIFLPSTLIGQFALTTANAQPLDSNDRFFKISTIISAVAKSDITNISLLDADNGAIVKFDDTVFFDSGMPGRVDGFRIPSVALTRGANYVLVVSVITRKPTGAFDKVDSSSLSLTLAAALIKKPIVPVGPTGQPIKPAARKSVLSMAKSSSKRIRIFTFRERW